MKRRAVKLFPLALVALIVAAFFGPLTAANAASTPNHGLKPLGSQSAATGNLTYHGGSVMDGTAEAFLIFWEPAGFGVTPEYNELMARWFKDVGHSPLYENNEQYTDAAQKAPLNAELENTFLDTRPYPANPMTDAQVQDEVTHVQTLKQWTSSIHHIFFVYTGAGEHNAFADTNGFCAYHDHFGTDAIYAAMVYPTVLSGCLAPLPSPNNDQIADSEINVTSHEQIEAATDPFLNAWFNPNTGEEIGDQCAFQFGPRDSLGGDVKYHGHPYLVQEEWDNAISGCTLIGTEPPR